MTQLLRQGIADRARDDRPAPIHPAIARLQAERDEFDRSAEYEDHFAYGRNPDGQRAPLFVDDPAGASSGSGGNGSGSGPGTMHHHHHGKGGGNSWRDRYRRLRDRGRGGMSSIARELGGGLAGPGAIGSEPLQPGTTTAAGASSGTGANPMLILIILAAVGGGGYLLWHKFHQAAHDEKTIDKEEEKGE